MKLEERYAEGFALGVKLAKRVFMLRGAGASIEFIAKECNLSEEKVRDILDLDEE